MGLTLRNSYTRALEPFVPLDPEGRSVTMYSCGPTVYSTAHIGNFRSFLFADVLRRTLTRRGYRVRQIMNITDVGHMTEDHLADATGEDKFAKAARELGQDPFAVARHYEGIFVSDAKTLRLALYQGQNADNVELHPRATEHIPEMLAMIQLLIDRGYAYCDGVGQVYFEVAKFADYGKLSGKDIDELEAGKRVAVRDEKKDPRDFALWKVDEKHLMKWDPHSPAGWPDAEWQRAQKILPKNLDARIRPGFPGWHIECSAMARAHLGDLIDIHTGGEDNVFPHHECEIAQSHGALGTTVVAPEGAPDAGRTRTTFARYWVHGRHLLVDGRKMSKRDGTFFVLRDLLDPVAANRPDVAERLTKVGFANGRVPANVLRLALISAPYTQPMNFTFDVLAQSKANVERLQSCADRLRERAGDAAPEVGTIGEIVRAADSAFDAGLDDDLNMPRALSGLFELVGALNAKESSLTAGEAAAALKTLEGIDAVLDVLDYSVRSGIVTTTDLKARAAVKTVAEVALPETLSADDIVEAIVLRQAAKMAKRFDIADGVRNALATRGITLEDLAQGVRWKR